MATSCDSLWISTTALERRSLSCIFLLKKWWKTTVSNFGKGAERGTLTTVFSEDTHEWAMVDDRVIPGEIQLFVLHRSNRFHRIFTFEIVTMELFIDGLELVNQLLMRGTKCLGKIWSSSSREHFSDFEKNLSPRNIACYPFFFCAVSRVLC